MERRRNYREYEDISRLDKLQEIELIACRGIPAQMSNLWSLNSLKFSRMCRTINTIDFPPVQFRSLTCLVLDGDDRNDFTVPSAMCSWVEQSCFPVLDTLRLKHIDRVGGTDRTTSSLGSWLARCKFPSLETLFLRRVGDYRGNQTTYDTLAYILMGLWHSSQAMIFSGLKSKSNLAELHVEFLSGWDKVKLGHLLLQILPIYVPALEIISVQCGNFICDDDDSIGEDNEEENNDVDDDDDDGGGDEEVEENSEGSNSDESDANEDVDNASNEDQGNEDGTTHEIMNDEDDTNDVGSLIQLLAQKLTVAPSYTPTFLKSTRTITQINIFGPHLGGFVDPRDKAAALTILKTYKRMVSFGPSLDTELETVKDSKMKEIEYYQRINHAGRVLVERAEGQRAIPLALWPKVFVRSFSSHPPHFRRFVTGGNATRPNCTGLYYLLRHGPAMETIMDQSGGQVAVSVGKCDKKPSATLSISNRPEKKARTE